VNIFQRIIQDEVGGVAAYGGALLSRNAVRFVQDWAAPAEEGAEPGFLAGETAGGLLELVMAGAIAAGSSFLPRSVQHFGDFAAVGAAAFGVARIASEQAPGSFADLRGANPMRRYRRYSRSMRYRGTRALTPSAARPLAALTPSAARPVSGTYGSGYADPFEAPFPAM
jgi:hypothetical protein